MCFTYPFASGQRPMLLLKQCVVVSILNTLWRKSKEWIIPNDIYHHQNDKRLYHSADRSILTKVLTILPMEYKVIKSLTMQTKYLTLILCHTVIQVGQKTTWFCHWLQLHSAWKIWILSWKFQNYQIQKHRKTLKQQSRKHYNPKMKFLAVTAMYVTPVHSWNTQRFSLSLSLSLSLTHTHMPFRLNAIFHSGRDRNMSQLHTIADTPLLTVHKQNSQH
jgi:hypothetical protein